MAFNFSDSLLWKEIVDDITKRTCDANDILDKHKKSGQSVKNFFENESILSQTKVYDRQLIRNLANITDIEFEEITTMRGLRTGQLAILKP